MENQDDTETPPQKNNLKKQKFYIPLFAQNGQMCYLNSSFPFNATA